MVEEFVRTKSLKNLFFIRFFCSSLLYFSFDPFFKFVKICIVVTINSKRVRFLGLPEFLGSGMSTLSLFRSNLILIFIIIIWVIFTMILGSALIIIYQEGIHVRVFEIIFSSGEVTVSTCFSTNTEGVLKGTRSYVDLANNSGGMLVSFEEHLII